MSTTRPRPTWIPILALLVATTATARTAPLARPGAAGARTAYVCELFGGTVSVVDLDRLAWRRDLAVGPYPVFAALAPHDSTRLLVTLHNYGREEDGDALIAVDRDAAADSGAAVIVARVGWPGPGMPSGFVFDPRRDRLYIADENLHCVHVHDATSLAWLFDLPAGLVPVHVALSPDARRLVVTNRKSADLTVYDLDRPRVEARDGIGVLHLGAAPRGDWTPGAGDSTAVSHPLDVHFASDTALCYVTDMTRNALLVVDLERWVVTARVPLAASPFDFAVDRAGALAYVCLYGGDGVAVVDLAARRVVRTIGGFGAHPMHCALDEDAGRLVVTCWGDDRSGSVHAVDLKADRPPVRVAVPGAKASIGLALAR
jgi:DNA-binding beta-propeller fold protein YncE